MNEGSKRRPIIVGWDDSPQAHDALALGAALATATGDALMLAGAYGPEGIVRKDELDARRAEVLERLTEAADSLPSDSSLQVERRAGLATSPAVGLQALAEAEHARARAGLLPPPGGRACADRRSGRVPAARFPCPVVVAPRDLAQRGRVELNTVCVGFDGGAEGWTALQRGAQIAAAAGARLRIALAVQPPAPTPVMPVFPPELLEERLKPRRSTSTAPSTA